MLDWTDSFTDGQFWGTVMLISIFVSCLIGYIIEVITNKFK